MPSIHEQLRYIYGDLDADYNRSALMRHAVDMEGALGDIGERVERSVKAEETNRVKIGIAMKADQVRLQRSIIESKDKLTTVNIKAWVDVSNNIRTNHQRMITGLAAKAQKSIERATDAYARNVGYGSTQEAPGQAAWEGVLGTESYPVGVSTTDPSSPFVLTTMNANYGEFIPEHHSQATQDNYNKLKAAAELQNTSITAYTNGLDEQQAELTSALGHMEEGNEARAQERLNAVAGKAGRLADTAITYATDEATQAKLVAAELAKDPEHLALREKTDRSSGQSDRLLVTLVR